MKRRTLVFGPAYLDRVLRVDRPLVDPRLGPPLDQSVDGSLEPREGVTILDPSGYTMAIDSPEDWPGPWGVIKLSRSLLGGIRADRVEVKAISWQDDLGGMGAGYAAALGGELISALGPDGDPTSMAVAQGLRRAGIAHRAIRVDGRPADWTLLISSGEFGDKLPIGFRGCHASLRSLEPWIREDGDLRVVAALPNVLAAQALRAPTKAVRLFAPAMRNMVDRDPPVSSFADAIDVLSCNRHEWESLEDREQVAWQVSILNVTDGAKGSRVRFTTPTGEPGRVDVPAFPRDRPPRDTNRAGEAFASTLVEALLDGGWSGGVVDEDLVRHAAIRASAAAALVLDLTDFGFPDARAIDEALGQGRVSEGNGDALDVLR